MKKFSGKSFLKHIVATIALVAAASQLHADDIPVSIDKLPVAAQTFIKENFSEKKVVLIMYDKEWTSASYEVTLDDGTEIEFSDKGEWIDIEGKSKSKLPDSVIPKTVLSYVQENFSGKSIKEISKKGYGYKVELTGDIELRFDKEGNFLSFDD